ncbi:MAG: hypothetical protein WC998_09625 [Candidatus Paceibacterota bacterium]|jgi:hypothetical protein
MAIVTGPLHSIQASGQFGKTMIFERWKGRSYAKVYKVPTVRRTDSQRAVRAIMKWLTWAWTVANDEQKETWNQLALEANVSPIAAYLKYNFNLWWTGWYSTLAYPEERAEFYGVLLNYGASGGIGSIMLEGMWDMAAEGFGVVFYQGVPFQKRIVAIMQPGIHPSSNFQLVEHMEPGTYTISGQCFSIDGACGDVFLVNDNVVVT